MHGGPAWASPYIKTSWEASQMTDKSSKEFLTTDQILDVASQDQSLRLEIIKTVIDYFDPSDEHITVAKAKTIYDWVSINKVTL